MYLIIAAVLFAGTLYLIVVLAGRLVWLGVLLVAWCVLASATAVMLVALCCQKLIEAVAEWRWRRGTEKSCRRSNFQNSGDMHIEPTDAKGHSLRIWPREAVVHNLRDMLWG